MLKKTIWFAVATLTVLPLYGFPYPIVDCKNYPEGDTSEAGKLPDENLIKNPWFEKNCAFSSENWEVNDVDASTPGVQGWDDSEKPQDPSYKDCGDKWNGHAIRWADRNNKPGSTFYEGKDAKFWQIVGPVSPDERQLNFHFLMVFHRMNHFRAQIYGAHSSSGPWQVVWTVIDKEMDPEWTVGYGPNGTRTCDATLVPGTACAAKNRDCLWDIITQEQLESDFALSKTIEQGFEYYKIEFLGNYPAPNNEANGDVGGKITRVFFSVGDAPEGSTGGEGPGSNAADGGVGGTGSAGSGGGSAAVTNNADSNEENNLGGCACDLRAPSNRATHASIVFAILFAGVLVLMRRRRCQ